MGIISLHFWFRDLIREFYKKYEVLLMVLFLACFIFLASEALLFISFFWGTFHSLSSPNYGMCPGEGLYVPDPCELTFANTLLLSNAAVSLGGAVVSLESSCSFSILFSLFSGILAWAFISLQIKEFRVMGFSINDSVYSSVFSLLTGLHFFHLVVGLFLLSLYYCSCSFHCKIDNLVTIRSSEVHLYYNLQVFYWHFLESLWLFIFLVLCLAYILGLTLHKLLNCISGIACLFHKIFLESDSRRIIFNNLVFILTKSHLGSYPCPLNINFYWNMGFTLGIVIVVQILYWFTMCLMAHQLQLPM